MATTTEKTALHSDDFATFSVAEAANALGVSRSHIYNLINGEDETFPVVWVGKERRVPLSRFREWFDGGGTPAHPSADATAPKPRPRPRRPRRVSAQTADALPWMTAFN